MTAGKAERAAVESRLWRPSDPWLDRLYRYDGAHPLASVHRDVAAELYAALDHTVEAFALYLAEDGQRIEGGFSVNPTGVTVIDLRLDLDQPPGDDLYASILRAIASGRIVVRSGEEGRTEEYHPLFSGGVVMGCLVLERRPEPVPPETLYRLASLGTYLSGALRYAATVRRAFLERRYWLTGVGLHRSDQLHLSADHALRRAAHHIQSTLGLDRCVIFGETASGWRRFAAGLQLAGGERRAARCEPPPGEGTVRKIGGSVLIMPLASRPHPGWVVFDNSISHAPFSDAEEGLLGLVRDAVAMLWAMSMEQTAERSPVATDELTGTFTRAYGLRYLEEWLGSVRTSRNPVAVLFVDGDRFKIVNDRFGHQAGDRLLAAIGQVLTEAVGEAGIVFRYGGDEFVAVLPDIGKEEVERLAGEILAQLDATLVPGLPPVRVSIGISLSSEHGTSAVELIESADRTMYAVKRAGGYAYRLARAQA